MSDAHPLFGGNLGHSGTPVASWFMNESDLILVFGASFSNHTGIDKSKPIIQVDFDQMMLGKTQPVAAPVWGEIATTTAILTERLGDDIIAQDQSDEIAERWAIWRAEKASRANDDNGRGVNSAAIFASMSRTLPEDAVIAVDVGNNTYSFGRYFECTRINLDVRLFGVDRVRVSRGPWRMVGDPRFPRIERPQGGFGQRRRWVRSVPGGFHHRCHVRHGHHPHPFEQQ